MSRTFTNLLTHVVFSTRNREPMIVPDLKPELYAYLGGLTRELKGKAYGINGTSDHIHMLVSLPPVVSISDALRFLKPIHRDGFTTSGDIEDLSRGNSATVRSVLASRMFRQLWNTFATKKLTTIRSASKRSL
jgi:REP element-mobilizing transposase RayT